MPYVSEVVLTAILIVVSCAASSERAPSLTQQGSTSAPGT
jgi:hypothetical protein